MSERIKGFIKDLEGDKARAEIELQDAREKVDKWERFLKQIDRDISALGSLHV